MKTKALLTLLVAGTLATGHAYALADNETASTSDPSATEVRVHDPAAVKAAVESAFKDAPVMSAIAECESKYRQYTDAGNVLRGGYGNTMIGIFQFNGPVHASFAKSIGFDIETVEGNIGYAKYVYGISGTDPWISSFGCWGKRTSQTASEGSKPSDFDADLSFGQTHPQVRLLQELLNRAGFAVSDEGPGSPGNETTMFGNLTRVAVRKFQCDKLDICSGDEYSTGYGFVDAMTRKVLQDEKVPARKAKKAPAEKPSAKSSKSTGSDAEAADLQTQIAKLLELVAELQRQIEALSRT